MPSRLSTILQGVAITSLTTIGGITVWTKHCHFEPVDVATDPIFKSTPYARSNPNRNPAFQDVCVRRIPLIKVDYSLVKDSENGGTKLVERFAQGMWAGRGFAIQRSYERLKYKDSSTAHQLWTVQQLRQSKYPVGTELVNHFNVVDRPDSNTIVMRAGDSPMNQPDGPRADDGLLEMYAKADMEQGFAEFRLKTVFYRGDGKFDKAPFEGDLMVSWAHRVYARILMESAVGNCKKGVFDFE